LFGTQALGTGDYQIVSANSVCFAFLDAYFTALEINSGAGELIDAVNPRVAVVLNLLTAGLGYFYLGERTKA